jgi:hypothetical protein
MAEPAAPAAVNLVDERTGEVVNVDEADLPSIGAGYRAATPEEVAADLQRQQYGEGFGNEAAAFGEGILSGATIGLSDVAAKAIAPEYAEGLAARREYNPTAAGVGEGVGVLGATLLSGGAGGAASAGARGAGLAARGARVLSAPARALVGLGEAATAGTGRLLGAEAATGVLGGALREAAAMGVGGAAEGALFGAAKAVTDDYLNDHEITAERIAMGAGDGMWMGGGLGAGLGLAGGVVGRGAKKVRDAFTRSDADREATRVLEEAVDATPGATGELGATGEATTAASAGSGAATSAEAEAAGATLSADQRILQQVGYKSDDSLMAELTVPTNPERVTAMERVRGLAEQADAAKRFGQLKTDKTNDVVRKIEEFRRIEDQLETYINKGHKKDAVKAAIETAPPEWSDAHFDRVLSSVDESRTRLSKMREDTYALDPTQHAALKDAVDMANELEARLKGFTGRKVQPQQGPLSPSAPAARYDAEAVAEIQDLHDKFKGALGRASRKAGNASPSHINAGEAALRREFMGHRALLEDETLYGKGATELQRVTNAAESEAILYQRAWDEQFGLADTRQTKRAGVDMEGKSFDGVQSFDKVSEASHPKIRNLMETVGDDPQAERTFALGLQRQADKIKTKADFYAMPPEMRAQALRAKALADEIVGSVRDVKATRQMAEEYAVAVNELRDIPLYGEQLAKLKIAFGRSANLIAKSDVATSLGATGGKASARAGASSGAQSAASQAIRNGMKSEGAIVRTAQGVGKWLRKAGDTATRVGERAAYAGRRVAKAGPLLGVSVSSSNPGSAEALIRNIGALQNPQSDERRAARLSRLELRQTNPRLAQALEDHTQRVADFLADKAGDLSVGPRPGDPFGQHRKPRHSPAKIDKMARYVDAATNPAGALDRIAAGNVTREDVEVLQALYPRMYRRVRDEVLQHVSTAEELPSYEARLKLGILVGAPTDPSMRPAMVQALQNVARSGAGAKADPQQQQQPAQQGPLSEPTLSPSARREPKLGKLYASQTDATSVAASRLGE